MGPNWSPTSSCPDLWVLLYYYRPSHSPVQVGCMRQVLRPGALGRPRGIGWRGRWEGGLGWGMYVNPWLIHVNVWQKPLQNKVISLQLIKINEKKNPSHKSILVPLCFLKCFDFRFLCLWNSICNLLALKDFLFPRSDTNTSFYFYYIFYVVSRHLKFIFLILYWSIVDW